MSHSHTRLAKQLARALPNQDPNYIQSVLDGLAALPDAPRPREFTDADIFEMFPVEEPLLPVLPGKQGEGVGDEGRAPDGRAEAEEPDGTESVSDRPRPLQAAGRRGPSSSHSRDSKEHLPLSIPDGERVGG